MTEERVVDLITEDFVRLRGKFAKEAMSEWDRLKLSGCFPLFVEIQMNEKWRLYEMMN